VALIMTLSFSRLGRRPKVPCPLLAVGMPGIHKLRRSAQRVRMVTRACYFFQRVPRRTNGEDRAKRRLSLARQQWFDGEFEKHCGCGSCRHQNLSVIAFVIKSGLTVDIGDSAHLGRTRLPWRMVSMSSQVGVRTIVAEEKSKVSVADTTSGSQRR